MWVTTPSQCAGPLLRDPSEATESPVSPRMAWDPPTPRWWPLVRLAEKKRTRLSSLLYIWFYIFLIQYQLFFSQYQGLTLTSPFLLLCYRSNRDDVHRTDAHCWVCCQCVCLGQWWTTLLCRGGEYHYWLVWLNSVKPDQRKTWGIVLVHSYTLPALVSVFPCTGFCKPL